jgi:hypothetical protein
MRRRFVRRAPQQSLVISSRQGAAKALAQLKEGGATLVKTFLHDGRPMLAIVSKEGEARISSDFHSKNSSMSTAIKTGLFGDSQTASISKS